MNGVEWTRRPPPNRCELDAMVLLVETDDGTAYYVHRSGQHAARKTDRGWEGAVLDRREDERREGLTAPSPSRRSGPDRRDPEADWTRFVSLYGNGEAGDDMDPSEEDR